MFRYFILSRVASALAVVTAVAVATAACSSDQPQPDDEEHDHFEFVISYAWERAEDVNAAPEQFAILERAREEGELSFELYSEAVDNSLRCLREQGVEPHDGGVREDRGYPKRFYSVPAEAEAADPVEFAPGATVHRCIAEHSIAVEGAYQNQPSSVEAQQARDRERFEPHREEIVACAQEEGIEIDPDGDIIEIVEAALAAFDLEETEVNCTEGIW